MLGVMIKIACKTILVLAAASTFIVNAGLYKGLDTEGNVVYSDKPFENSEQMTPPPITVVDAPKVIAKEAVEEIDEKPPETRYTHLSIKSPENNQTIWNEPALMVSLSLKPALDIEQGHRTWLIMDGKPLVKNSQSLTLPIGRADRGQHQLQAQVRNNKGKILKSSNSIQIHIKNSVVPVKAPR